MPAQVFEQSLSARAEAVSRAVSHILSGYLEEIDYFTRRDQPGVLDFTFGDPREMPPRGVCLGPADGRHAAATRAGSPTRCTSLRHRRPPPRRSGS